MTKEGLGFAICFYWEIEIWATRTGNHTPKIGVRFVEIGRLEMAFIPPPPPPSSFRGLADRSKNRSAYHLQSLYLFMTFVQENERNRNECHIVQ